MSTSYAVRPDKATDKKYCLWTNDVETTSIWYNCLRDETGRQVLEAGLPILLDIYAEFGVKSTFYFTGYIAERFPDVVKLVTPYGHEVGSHGYSHELDQAFDVLPYAKQVEHLVKSKRILEDLSGQEVISFRAPALRMSDHTAKALIEAGYRTDSSVASQRFDMFLTFGSRKKLKWLTAPRLPYRVDERNIFSKGDSELVEIPLTALGFPYVGTTMRIFPWVTRLQRRIVNMESSINRKPVVFDIHPNEFLNEETGRRTIQRRARNPIQYLLTDVIRGRLKVKNLGKKAVPLYRDEIAFYQKRDYRFVTVADYCREMGLLS